MGLQHRHGWCRGLRRGRAQEGMHAAVQHGVGFHGGKFDVPFETTTARLSSTRRPSRKRRLTARAVPGHVPLDAGSARVCGGCFGLSQPSVTTETVVQDDPNDPSSATVKKSLSLSHAARLTIDLDTPADDDVDLFLVHDSNGDGAFTNGEIIGASTRRHRRGRAHHRCPPGGRELPGLAPGLVRLGRSGDEPDRPRDLPGSGQRSRGHGVPTGPVPAVRRSRSR